MSIDSVLTVLNCSHSQPPLAVQRQETAEFKVQGALLTAVENDCFHH